MIYFIMSMFCFFLGGLLIGYLWGEARGTRDTECRWSIAVRRAAHPRRPLTEHLPPSERRHWDRVDQPNGTCSACGAPLNAYLMDTDCIRTCIVRLPKFTLSFVRVG